MEMYGNVWKCIENLWKCIENQWKCMEMYRKSMEIYGNVLKCIKMFGNELKLSLSFLAIFSVFLFYGKCIENLMGNLWKCMEMYNMYQKTYKKNLLKFVKIYRNV